VLKKFLFIIVLFTSITYSQDYAKGKQLFNTHCAACHKMDRKLVGPPLQDVVELQGRDWTKTWIKNSKALIDSGDEHAVEIWEEYNRAAMPAYNFLPDTDLDDIVEYLASYKTKKAETIQATQTAAPSVGQTTVVSNQSPPWYIILLVLVALVLFIVALYAIQIALTTIMRIVHTGQSTNLYLMKKLHMDKDEVNKEFDDFIKDEVNKKVNTKIKTFKKDLNKKLKDL
tara:strand:- start:150 stop:833 length:684 start_codon:yes stop_codon:yes gene_type:complete